MFNDVNGFISLVDDAENSFPFFARYDKYESPAHVNDPTSENIIDKYIFVWLTNLDTSDSVDIHLVTIEKNEIINESDKKAPINI